MRLGDSQPEDDSKDYDYWASRKGLRMHSWIPVGSSIVHHTPSVLNVPDGAGHMATRHTLRHKGSQDRFTMAFQRVSL